MKRIQTDTCLKSVLIKNGKKMPGVILSDLLTKNRYSLPITFVAKSALPSIISTSCIKINALIQGTILFKRDYRYYNRFSEITTGWLSQHGYVLSPENSFAPIYVINVFFNNVLKINTNYENSGSETV